MNPVRNEQLDTSKTRLSNGMKCTKAIIPVAGYGTRRLPVTKAIEKCMLPLLNRPIIDYVVEDCIKAGITDIYFVVSEGAGQLRHYYSRDMHLEEYLKQNGKEKMLPSVLPPENVRFHFIEQDQQDPRYGTTVPVWLARDFVDPGEHILIIMGDQCLYREDGGSESADLIKAVEADGASAGLIGVEVPEELVSQYGIIESDENSHYSRIVEKPQSPQEVNSRLNNASFYLMPYEFFQFVDDDMHKPHDAEYMITDPLNAFTTANNSTLVYTAKGEYLDCGTVEGWVKANDYLLANYAK